MQLVALLRMLRLPQTLSTRYPYLVGVVLYPHQNLRLLQDRAGVVSCPRQVLRIIQHLRQRLQQQQQPLRQRLQQQ